ncbi:MAG: DUF262 domain-containing protein [Rhodocyclaceae bacterium]|nr:DUF262 domain-containing protein [Rhodocyclaceae bacterium]
MFVVRPFQATTLSWWHAERDQIDLSPPYQRSPGVWSNSDKAYLIDSIINGYDVPKFYIADFSYVSSALNLKGKPFAVIDGRQRFEAMFDFLDGRIRLNRDMVYLGEERYSLAGMNYFELKEKFPKIAQRVENFNITVMSVITDREEMINDLFVRLNRSKPLTGAEVRSAMIGEVPRLIREISSTPFFTECIAFSTNRKQQENVAAKLLLIEHRGDFVETKKVNLDRFAREAALTEMEFQASAERVITVLEDSTYLFKKNDPLLKASGIVPIYYWLIRNGLGRPDLRDRLERFERFRATVRGHPAIEVYNNVSRSTNDPSSYKARYAVLAKFVTLESDEEIPRDIVPMQAFVATD